MITIKVVALSSILYLKDVEIVNNRYNKFDYISDYDFIGKADYWQHPEEFERNRKGDCEDYAIAKYNALLRMGVDPDTLRLAYVILFKNGKKEAHMVLLLQHGDDDFWVLDNAVKSIELLSHRLDIIPVYSFNTHELWEHDNVTGEIEQRPYSEHLGPVKRLRNLIRDDGMTVTQR